MIDIVLKILKIFDENNLWDEGVELIGSWCFLLYQKHYGVKEFPLRTVDIDFLIPCPYRGKNKIDLINLLSSLGFKTSHYRDGSIYLWNAELRIDFISPQRSIGMEKVKEVRSLGLKTIPLRFMDILLENPVLVNEEGIKVLIPNPLAFAFHKLLISDRRIKKEKREKDLRQAILVLEVVSDKKAVKIFNKYPRKWKKSILKMLEESLKLFPLNRDIIETKLVALQNQ